VRTCSVTAQFGTDTFDNADAASSSRFRRGRKDIKPPKSMEFIPSADNLPASTLFSYVFEMPFSLVSILAPVHLLAYSALLGTELYQTFIMTKVTFQSLPRSAFTTLQKRVFPIYFQTQSLGLLFVALTAPPCGPTSLLQTKTEWISLIVAGVTAGLNLLIYGPRTKDLMVERVHQGMRACFG
jgi:hypothetical protein